MEYTPPSNIINSNGNEQSSSVEYNGDNNQVVVVNGINGIGINGNEDEQETIFYRCPSCANVFFNISEFDLHECGTDSGLGTFFQDEYTEIIEIPPEELTNYTAQYNGNGNGNVEVIVDDEEFILGISSDNEELAAGCVSVNDFHEANEATTTSTSTIPEPEAIVNGDPSKVSKNALQIVQVDEHITEEILVDKSQAPAQVQDALSIEDPLQIQVNKSITGEEPKQNSECLEVIKDSLRVVKDFNKKETKLCNGPVALNKENETPTKELPKLNLKAVPLVKVESLSKPDLFKLVQKKVIRICLDDIGLSVRMTCEFCSKRIQLIKFRKHQEDEHSDELRLRYSRMTQNANARTVRSRSGSSSLSSLESYHHKSAKYPTRSKSRNNSCSNSGRKTTNSLRTSNTTSSSVRRVRLGRKEVSSSSSDSISESDSESNSSSSSEEEQVIIQPKPKPKPKMERKTYKCQYCTKSFIVASQCKSHENTHTQHKIIVEAQQQPPPPPDEPITVTTPTNPLLPPPAAENVIEVVKQENALGLEENKSQITDEEKATAKSTVDTNQVQDQDIKPEFDSSILETTLMPAPKFLPIKHKRSISAAAAMVSNFDIMKENIISNNNNNSVVLSPNSVKIEIIAADEDNNKLETCQTCGDEIPISKLLEHIYSHIQKNQRQCSLCDYLSYASNDLKDHLHSKHYGLKPHICLTCNRGFGWTSALRGHQDTCHNNKQFKCKYCKKRFETNRERRRHELVHKNISGPSQGQFPPRPPVKVNGLSSAAAAAAADVLKTKRNIQQQHQEQRRPDRMKTPPPLGTSSASVTSKMSPEINSFLDHYVCNDSDLGEHIIELDLMKEEDYGNNNFLDSLTKPNSFPFMDGSDSIVAFAVTSNSTAETTGAGGGTNTTQNYQWDPINNNNNNITTNNFMGTAEHVMMMAPPPNNNNNNNAVPQHQQQQQQLLLHHQHQLPQHFQNQHQLPPPLMMPQQIPQPMGSHSNDGSVLSSATSSMTSGGYNNNQTENSVSASASPSLAGDAEEDDLGDDDGDEDDDEYYRDEDKRYVEPPDTRENEPCKTCGLVIPMALLKEHIQSHVIKGQLECSICNYKAFNSKYLLDHLNIHYALKPYECDKCGRHFTFHGYLRSHIKQVHMKSKDRPHECRYCDKKFVRPCHRRTHERIHKGEIPKAKRPPSATTSSSSSATPNPTPPPPIPKPVFKTPTKNPNAPLDPAEILLSSPANIQPKMTATWPPMNPHYQDPWLNPIHSERNSRINNNNNAQQQQAQHYPQQNFPSNSLSSTSTDSGLYYNYQSNVPNPLYQNNDPKLYQPPTINFSPQQQQHPQQQQLQQLTAFGQPFTPIQSQRPILQSPATPQQQQSWISGSSSGGGPNNNAFNNSPSASSSFSGLTSSTPSMFSYNTQTSMYEYNVFNHSSSPNVGLYNNNSNNNSFNQNTLSSPQISNTNNLYNQPPPSSSILPSTSSAAPPTNYELSDLGFGFSSSFDNSTIGGGTSQPGDYSISAPQNFDLWAELRDEELKLFAESGPLINDPFPSSAANYSRQAGIDDLLFGTAPTQQQQPILLFNNEQQQSHFNSYNNNQQYIPMLQPPGSQNSTSSSRTFDTRFHPQQQQPPQIPGFSSSAALFDPTKIKVKIKRIHGQATLINANAKSKLAKLIQPSTSTSASASFNNNNSGNASCSTSSTTSTMSNSREIIPAGGRRLSSDDLDEKLDELTNKSCLICKQLFSAGSKDILEHISSHLERGQVHCPVCDRSFAHSWYLKVHTYKHYGIKLYECTYCQRKFSKRHSLAAHIEQTHANNSEMLNSQVCEFCKKVYSSRFALKKHQQNVHKVVLKREPPSSSPLKKGNLFSNICGRNANNNNNNSTIKSISSSIYKPKHLLLVDNIKKDVEEMEIRIKEQHLNVFSKNWTVVMEDIGRQTTICPICKENINIKDMLTHKTQHTEDCHICGKTVSASELISHGSTHVSILVCEICGWKGKQKSQLWEHMNGHLGCKPLKCEYCGVGFASRSSVRLHTIARHTNIRLHKCDFCDARFVTPQVKRMHQLQHYDTNCPFCNKYFALKKDLAKHIRIHYKMTGQKLVLNLNEEKEKEKQQQQSTTMQLEQQPPTIKLEQQPIIKLENNQPFIS